MNSKRIKCDLGIIKSQFENLEFKCKHNRPQNGMNLHDDSVVSRGFYIFENVFVQLTMNGTDCSHYIPKLQELHDQYK